MALVDEERVEGRLDEAEALVAARASINHSATEPTAPRAHRLFATAVVVHVQ